MNMMIALDKVRMMLRI